jgi:hypothetical protein
MFMQTFYYFKFLQYLTFKDYVQRDYQDLRTTNKDE